MSIAGDWQIQVHTPKGDFEWVLSIVETADAFTGTLDMVESKVALEEGAVDGDQLTWKSTLRKPQVLRFSGRATVDGDRIRGEFRMGAFGTRSFGGRRVSPAPTAIPE
ncbi:hypothetical protein ACWCPI_09495 [Streptomyces sp. NPDC001920]